MSSDDGSSYHGYTGESEYEFGPDRNSYSSEKTKTRFKNLKKRVVKESYPLPSPDYQDVESIDLADIDDLDSDNAEDKKKIQKARAKIRFNKHLRQEDCRLVYRPKTCTKAPAQANLDRLAESA